MNKKPTQYRDAPQSLLDRRVGVGGKEVRLSLYRLQSTGGQVRLREPHLFYYGVLSGKKIVYDDDGKSTVVGSGESLIVPPLQTIVVEFPEHRDSIQYVALKIDRAQVRSILDELPSASVTASEPGRWNPEEEAYFRVDQEEGIARVLDTIEFLFRESPPNRDHLIDLNAEELLVQLLHTRAQSMLVGDLSRETSAGGLAAAVQYIQANLDRHISVDELVEEALMSKSTFYRHFSDEFDMSPLEYITRERIIRARELLSDPDNTVTSVSHALGFSSTSHFIDTFKEHEGITPKQYQLDVTE